MIEYKVYSNEILLNNVLFVGMKREEMEKHILKMLREKDFSIFKVEVDVLYLLKQNKCSYKLFQVFQDEKRMTF